MPSIGDTKSISSGTIWFWGWTTCGNMEDGPMAPQVALHFRVAMVKFTQNHVCDSWLNGFSSWLNGSLICHFHPKLSVYFWTWALLWVHWLPFDGAQCTEFDQHRHILKTCWDLLGALDWNKPKSPPKGFFYALKNHLLLGLPLGQLNIPKQ